MSRKTLFLGTAAFHMTAAERAKGRFMRAPDEHPAPAPAAADPAPAPAADPAPAAADPAPAPTPTPDEAFASAFAEAAAPAAPTPKPADKPAGGDPAPAAPAPAAAPEPKPAEPAAPDPAPAAPAAAPTADDIVRQLAERLAAPPAAPAAPAPAAPAPEPALYNDEETALISAYQENWPDVHKAEQALRKGEYHDLLKFVFTEMDKRITPIADVTRTMGNTLHTQELRERVPDYQPAVEGEVNTWIETQPAYLQPAYKHVMQSGTSEEVADLIGRYRAANGIVPAPAAPAPAPAPAGGPAPAPAAKPAAKPASELSQAAKQAVVSLAPVSSDRSQAPAGEDTQDFKSAFDRYAATV